MRLLIRWLLMRSLSDACPSSISLTMPGTVNRNPVKRTASTVHKSSPPCLLSAISCLLSTLSCLLCALSCLLCTLSCLLCALPCLLCTFILLFRESRFQAFSGITNYLHLVRVSSSLHHLSIIANVLSGKLELNGNDVYLSLNKKERLSPLETLTSISQVYCPSINSG